MQQTAAAAYPEWHLWTQAPLLDAAGGISYDLFNHIKKSRHVATCGCFAPQVEVIEIPSCDIRKTSEGPEVVDAFGSSSIRTSQLCEGF